MPNLAFFTLLAKSESLTICLNSKFKKRSYFNRTNIAAANGKLLLSVPSKKPKNSNATFGAIEIAYDEDWQKKHYESVYSAYHKSPYFELLEEEFKALIYTKYQFVYELNFAMLKWVLQVLQYDIPINISTSEILQISDNQIDIRRMFQTKSISLWYLSNKYYQLFIDKNGFLENLSILDLLFLKGDECRRYLSENYKAH